MVDALVAVKDAPSISLHVGDDPLPATAQTHPFDVAVDAFAAAKKTQRAKRDAVKAAIRDVEDLTDELAAAKDSVVKLGDDYSAATSDVEAKLQALDAATQSEGLATTLEQAQEN
jgi:hypothetical protein